jgi:hypothetical protein
VFSQFNRVVTSRAGLADSTAWAALPTFAPDETNSESRPEQPGSIRSFLHSMLAQG